MIKSVNFGSEKQTQQKKSSNVFWAGVGTGIVAYPIAYYAFPSSMDISKIVELDKDTFEKKTDKIEGFNSETKMAVSNALGFQQSIDTRVEEQLEQILFNNEDKIDAKEILHGLSIQEYKHELAVLKAELEDELDGDTVKKGIRTLAAETAQKAEEAAIKAAAEGADDNINEEAKTLEAYRNYLNSLIKDSEASIAIIEKKLAIVDQDGKVAKDAYKNVLKEIEKITILKEIEKYADQLKELKAPSHGKAAFVGLVVALVTGLAIKLFSPKQAKAPETKKA